MQRVPELTPKFFARLAALGITPSARVAVFGRLGRQLANSCQDRSTVRP